MVGANGADPLLGLSAFRGWPPCASEAAAFSATSKLSSLTWVVPDALFLLPYPVPTPAPHPSLPAMVASAGQLPLISQGPGSRSACCPHE